MEIGDFRQLIVDGKRATRARYPNVGEYMKVVDIEEHKVGHVVGNQTFTIDQNFPGGNLANKQAEIVMKHIWSISRSRIQHSKEKQVSTLFPVGWLGHEPWTSASQDKEIFLTC